MSVLKNSKGKWTILALFCLGVLLVACHKKAAKTTVIEPAPIQVTDTMQVDKGRLLFVNLEFFKTASGKDTCVLINTVIAEGRMKQNAAVHHHSNNQEEVVCSFTDCAGNVLLEEHIDNPLSAVMDTYNPDGSIGAAQVNFDRREVGLRVQIQPVAFCYLKIEKKKENNIQLISLIKL